MTNTQIGEATVVITITAMLIFTLWKLGFFHYNENELQVMDVSIDLTKNEIKTINWYGEELKPFCGPFSYELLDKIKPYCRVKDPETMQRPTTIYIWAGMENKHLAYCEPIDNYMKNYELIKTGQGYHHGSGKTCKWWLPNFKV